MDIFGHERSLHEGVAHQDVLLSGLAGLCLYCLGHGVSVGHLAGLEAFKVGGAVCDGHVGDGVGEVLEVGVAGHEVGLAAEAYQNALTTCDASLDGAFRCLTVGPLGCNHLALLADDADSFLEVAFCLLERLLAVHHTGGSHLT